MPVEWTAERLELLHRHAGEMSSDALSKFINEQTGASFTRNAIIGKRHRLKLPGCPVSISTRPRRLPSKRLRPAVRLPVSVAPVESLNIPFMDLEAQHCRYITSPDGAPALFCGQPVLSDKCSWCAWHHSVVSESVNGRRVVSFRKGRITHYAAEQGRSGISALY